MEIEKNECCEIHCTKNKVFPLRISSVNVTKFADLVTITEEILNGKLHFLCSDSYLLLKLSQLLLQRKKCFN